MSPVMSPAEPTYLDKADPDRLAGLLFELAAQLHIERQKRMALEAALIARGVLEAKDVSDISEDPALLEAARDEVDRSIRSMLRVVMEDGDLKQPLRAERQGS